MVDKNKPQQEKRGGWLSRFAPGVRKIVSRRDTPDNLWVKDPDTGEMLYRSDLEASLWVTPSGRHMRIDAPTRLRFTFDDGKYEAVDTPDVPEDPLKFSDGKSYKDRLNAARKAAGRKDTMAIGFGERVFVSLPMYGESTPAITPAGNTSSAACVGLKPRTCWT